MVGNGSWKLRLTRLIGVARQLYSQNLSLYVVSFHISIPYFRAYHRAAKRVHVGICVITALSGQSVTLVLRKIPWATIEEVLAERKKRKNGKTEEELKEERKRMALGNS